MESFWTGWGLESNYVNACVASLCCLAGGGEPWKSGHLHCRGIGSCSAAHREQKQMDGKQATCSGA
eukprot:917297-Amphidinium_carterae.1